MTQGKGQFVRRNYFINKGFQLRFSALIFITTTVIGIIAVWTTYITTWNEISALTQDKAFYEQIRSAYEKKSGDVSREAMVNSIVVVEFSDIFDRVSSTLVLRLLAGAFVLFVLSIFVSHKIAGPIFRMENAANAISEGDLSIDVGKLRAGDELAELAGAINGAISKLRTLMERYRDMAGKLTDLASKISVYKEGGQNASIESAQLIKELEVVSNQLVTEMNYFKTKKETIDNSLAAKKKEEITHY
ncbi:MAG: HAMP domain-containing protein [Candidatus Omnitrophica bacterium]|jgi:methyl-accepting chemotaxis protein|nr:HAMP domain-containing protein [Candidatus Omnitrophota bacterium]